MLLLVNVTSTLELALELEFSTVHDGRGFPSHFVLRYYSILYYTSSAKKTILSTTTLTAWNIYEVYSLYICYSTSTDF